MKDQLAGEEVPAGVALHTTSVPFESWYRLEFVRLVRVLRGLGADAGTAEEVAAEAFSRALERWDRVATMASPTGWVYQVAFNLQRRRRRLHLMPPAFLPPPGGGPAMVGDRLEVWDEVRRLPKRQRDAVVLHYLLDLPYREVAQIMGVSEGTVGAALFAARGHLAGRLADEGTRQ